MKCYVVKDLLPTYIDGLTCEEVNDEIENHLSGCSDCRTVYEQMLTPIPREVLSGDENIHFLKKIKLRMREGYAAAIVLTCVIMIGLMFFMYNYKIPVSFDPEVMRTEIFKAAPITENSLTQWINLDDLDFNQTKKVLEEDSAVTDRIQLILTEEITCDEMQTYTRTINRSGEPVRVTYYCYTKRLWNLIFGDSRRSRRMISEGDMYADSNNSLNYEKQMREIYYLPKGGIEKLDRLSDGEFDAQKKHAIQVWSGIL